MRNVENLANVFPMDCTHTVVAHVFVVFFQFLVESERWERERVRSLTSQKMRWVVFVAVLSNLLGSVFFFSVSNRELTGVLK